MTPYSRFAGLIGLFLLIFLASPQLEAHKPSDSYLKVEAGGEELTVQWDISIKDLEMVIGLDTNEDRAITWGELRAKHDEISAYALQRLTLSADGQEATLAVRALLVNRHSDGQYAVLRIDTGLPGEVETLEIDYRLLFDLDPTHRGLLRFDSEGTTGIHILGPDTPRLVLNAASRSSWKTFLEFVVQGGWHILIGTDHILFLLCLLIPSVLLRGSRSREPVESFWPAFREVAQIVTVFTIAHSITLWLAAMEYVVLPSRWIEAIIALSIIVAAFNNLSSRRLSGWTFAFGFGLVHGFGFANVLQDLGMGGGGIVIALFGFNVGVELVQLAMVIVYLPVAFLLRKTVFYRRWVVGAGSILIAIVAAVWFLERAFALEIPGI